MGWHRVEVGGIVFEVLDRYQNLRPLGQGAYGIVVGADDLETGKSVAIKKVPDIAGDVSTAQRILRELKLLRHFQGHANIIGIVNVMTVPPNTRDFADVYIVTDLMETDLERIVQSHQTLTERHVKYFLYQLLRGLLYIHSATVLHRDLKPSNLLINSNCDLAVCDFGLARGVGTEKELDLTGYVVTRWYRAPELLLPGSSKSYGPAVDVWAAGCILAEMFNRRPLLAGRNFKDQLNLIIKTLGAPGHDDVQFVTDDRVREWLLKRPKYSRRRMADIVPSAPSAARDLIRRMLAFDPRKRISVEEALAHPFVAEYRVPKDELRCTESFPYDESFDESAGESVALDIRREMYNVLLHFQPDALTQTMRLAGPVPRSTGASAAAGPRTSDQRAHKHRTNEEKHQQGEGEGEGEEEEEEEEEEDEDSSRSPATSHAAATAPSPAVVADSAASPDTEALRQARKRANELESLNARLARKLERQEEATESLSQRVLHLSNELSQARRDADEGPGSRAGAGSRDDNGDTGGDGSACRIADALAALEDKVGTLGQRVNALAAATAQRGTPHSTGDASAGEQQTPSAVEQSLAGLDKRVSEAVTRAVAAELDSRLPALLGKALRDAFLPPAGPDNAGSSGAEDGASRDNDESQGSLLAGGLADAVARRVAEQIGRGELSNSRAVPPAPAGTPHAALPPPGAFSQTVPGGDGWDSGLPTVSADVLSPHIDVHAPTHPHRAATRAEAARREQEAAAGESQVLSGGAVQWGSGEDGRSERSGQGSVEVVSDGLWEATVTLMAEDEGGVAYAEQRDDVPTATYRA